MDSCTLRALNPFGQQPSLYKLYTQMCYIFPVQDAAAYVHIENSLQNGIRYLFDAFPWVAGQVVLEGAENGSSGTYSIRASNKSSRLPIRDLRHEPSAPTLDKLRAARFPVAMLNEDLIAPCKTLEMAFGSHLDAAQVLLLQVNYIRGGLIFTIAGQHNVMDMTGQAEVTRLLSKACRSETFTSDELKIGNFCSAGAIELLDDSVDVHQETGKMVLKPQDSPAALSATASPPPECIWVFINFDAASLASIKGRATEAMTSDFISSDDALSALIWQAMVRARLPRLLPDRIVTFARAIDPRRYLKELPPKYPGLVQNMAFSMSTVQELTQQPLGIIASLLRSAVDPKSSDLEQKTRAFATLIHRSKDKSNINVTSSLDLSADIMLSSWVAVTCYEDDFGLKLGKPEMVRRPGFTPVESLVYLLPKTPTGDVTAMLCMRSEELERLRSDDAFAEFGSFIE